jgi:hypothetical protein
MGNRNFRQFPSPLELGRSTTTTPALRKSLLAPFTDVEDVPIDIDEDGVARPRPPGEREREERARRRAGGIGFGTTPAGNRGTGVSRAEAFGRTRRPGFL